MAPSKELIHRLSAAVESRPVRWSSPDEVVGDYDGRERTLEVFNADAGEQRLLLRKMRPLRAELEATAGGPVIVIFHTRGESARLYADFIKSASQADARADTTASAIDAPGSMPQRSTGRPGKRSPRRPERRRDAAHRAGPGGGRRPGGAAHDG